MRLKIEGMTCGPCTRAVEAAIPRARANNLKKEAEVIGEAPPATVEAAGYRALSLEAQDG